MEQHRKPQHLIRFHTAQGVQDMFPHAVAVMRMILRRLHCPVEFREKHFCDAGVIGCPQIVRVRREH